MRRPRPALSAHLRAMVALLLVLTSAFGSYAHAVCPHSSASLQAHADHHASEAAVDAASGKAGEHQHHESQSGVEHASCCDALCHGSYAVLTKVSPLPVHAGPVADTAIATIRSEPRTSSLERPPRTSLLA
jgi:hypothetical protein